MICRIARTLIPLFAEGDLPGRLATRLSDHLARCEACASEHRRQEASQNRVKQAASLDLPPPLPVDFAAKIREELAADRVASATPSEAPRSPFRRLPIGAWATAAALLLAVLGLMYEPLTETPSIPTTQEALVPDGTSTPITAETAQGETFSPAELAVLMSRLNPDRSLTDEELDAKYPTVESLTHPQGIHIVYRTEDPHITIVWVLPGKEKTSNGNL